MTDFQPFDDTLVYSSYIREYHPIEKDLLYNDLCRNSFNEFHRKETTLYMIVKTDRIEFVPESFCIGGGFRVQGNVRVGGRVEAVVFNVAKFLFARSGVTDRYSCWEEWAEQVMSDWQIDGDAEVTAAQTYRQFSKIDLKLSTGELLYIDCKLSQAIKQGNMASRTIVSPVQLAQSFDWNLLGQLEVLYIGKSTDGVLSRARNHNKWGAITTDLSPEEVAIVYFMDIETKSTAREQTGPFVTFREFKDKGIDRESHALITEAALIKHFFSEKRYNERIVGQDFEKVKRVKEKLLHRGYTSVFAELRLDGVFGNVGTPKTGYRAEHEYIRSLREL
ncbi:MAG: hypothetical protein C0467_30635 [Planctomycetaceae bacterium]|nr:hypothetical protein [Planctomycetaceae bacterium]